MMSMEGTDSDGGDILCDASSALLNASDVNALGDDTTDLLGGSMGAEGGGTGSGPLSDDDELPHVLREQDRYLPIANVAKAE